MNSGLPNKTGLTATESATPTTSPTYGPTPTLTAIPTEEAPEPLQSATYLYDGDGNLVKSVVNSTLGNTTTTYFPGKHYSVEEKGGALKVQKHYAAGSTTIAVRTVTAEADTLQWMISDHLPLQGASRGSTSTTANADGTWNSDIRYTAFGEIRLKSGVTASGYRYTGQLDMRTGTQHENARKVTFPPRGKAGMRAKLVKSTALDRIILLQTLVG